MSTYFIATWTCHVTEEQAERIDREVKKIDPEMDFVRHYAAGTRAFGWLERPNDGTNDYDFRRESNRQARAIADQILTGRTVDRSQALSDINALYGFEDSETVMAAIAELEADALTDAGLKRIAELQREKENRLFRESEKRGRK